MLKLKKTVSIRNQVLEQLRELIVKNEIPSGSRIYEERLADELGVSRTPIREALHVLDREGFLEAIPRVGYVVKQLEFEDFEEIIEIRKELEALTAIWTSHRLKESTKKDLFKNIKKSAEAIELGDVKSFMDLNQKFHEIIDQGSGRKRICELNQSLRRYAYSYLLRRMMDIEIMKKAQIGHEAIYDAIQSKDEAKIRKEIYSHLEDIRKDLLSSLKK